MGPTYITYTMPILVAWIGVFLIMFIIARIFSLLGKVKWSPFAKTTWKTDFCISLGIATLFTFLPSLL
ncbi:hypothetical protein [Metabacillus arenae]|uniref:DUF1656 domain-containing protein n=1 Tax=Metabacillus arenae TaxID=2771434 RepID=A0A926NLI0_9BACI|nr:hypothetical protein [Metabacillus arenae]MBD1383591.1 hypothetical protein [Metabacillus arenae]